MQVEGLAVPGQAHHLLVAFPVLELGVMGQQLFFQPSPDESRRVVAQKVFGKEKLPPFSAIGKSWKNAYLFIPKDLSFESDQNLDDLTD